MRNTFWLLFLIGGLSGCLVKKSPGLLYHTKQLEIQQINENLFVHVSFLQTNDFGKVGCNGLVYIDGDEAIIFDTPTDDVASVELIKWVEDRQKKKIKNVIITHFHDDCLGGIKAFHKRNIESVANQRTIDLLKEKGEEVLPQTAFEGVSQLQIGHAPVDLTFFGEGHTVDNIVAYMPKEQAIFGGCLIKTMNATKGYTGDANTAAWSETVTKIKQKYPDLKVVVPGHGAYGGSELLDYTIQLFLQ